MKGSPDDSRNSKRKMGTRASRWRTMRTTTYRATNCQKQCVELGIGNGLTKAHTLETRYKCKFVNNCFNDENLLAQWVCRQKLPSDEYHRRGAAYRYFHIPSLILIPGRKGGDLVYNALPKSFPNKRIQVSINGNTWTASIEADEHKQYREADTANRQSDPGTLSNFEDFFKTCSSEIVKNISGTLNTEQIVKCFGGLLGTRNDINFWYYMMFLVPCTCVHSNAQAAASFQDIPAELFQGLLQNLPLPDPPGA